MAVSLAFALFAIGLGVVGVLLLANFSICGVTIFDQQHWAWQFVAVLVLPAMILFGSIRVFLHFYHEFRNVPQPPVEL